MGIEVTSSLKGIFCEISKSDRAIEETARWFVIKDAFPDT